MKFAEKMRNKGLLPGYVTQKALEIIFISVMLAVSGFLIEKYSSSPQYYGIYNHPGLFDCLASSFGLTLFFSIFTLYPVVMLAPLAVSRIFLSLDRAKTAIISALSSLSYVLAWSFFTDFFVNWIMWIIFISTTLFVFWSSFLFYSTQPTDKPVQGELSRDL